MSAFYVPIIKTTDAEFRALENLTEAVKSKMIPFLELARSRSSKTKPEGDILRRMERLSKVYPDGRFFLDLTTDQALSNSQVKKLQTNDDGYAHWVKFAQQSYKYFPKMIPVIQINDQGTLSLEDHYNKIKIQVTGLLKTVETIAYRFPLDYEDYDDDLEQILEATSSEKIFCVIDAEFVTQGKSDIYAKAATNTLKMLAKLGIKKVILSSTSFPMSPTEFGEDDEGDYSLEERQLYSIAYKEMSSLIYSDYATVHHKRSEQAGGNGWVPRIDLPVNGRILYYRDRRAQSEDTYAPAYIRVAKRIVAHPLFDIAKKATDTCWGIKQIELAAQGMPQGLSPSFWISVRMNIHLSATASALSSISF